MSRCLSCNRVLSSSDFKYKQPETKEHDGFCSPCRNLCFEVNEYNEYIGGDDSLIYRIQCGEVLTTGGLGSLINYSDDINGDEDYE